MPLFAIHPLANLLPRMTPGEFGALVEDIRLLGWLREPIVLLEGKILDGRHRADACEQLGIDPATVDYDPAWGSPVRYVYSKAVHRNLTDSQKAAAAVLIAEEIGKEAKERSAANLKQGGNFATSEPQRVLGKPAAQTVEAKTGALQWPQHAGKTRPEIEAWLKSLPRKSLASEVEVCEIERSRRLGTTVPPVKRSYLEMVAFVLDETFGPSSAGQKSRDIAGTLFGVSGRYVQDAKLVYTQQPKLFADVMAGTLTLSRAKAEVRRHVKRDALAKAAKAPDDLNGKWEIIQGDCVEKMETLARRSFNLIFADPPYNLGVDYGDGEKADKLPDEDFLAWSRKWIGQCAELLSPVGTMLVLINDEWADHFGLMLRDAGLTRRAWIKWYESFGVNCLDNFNRCSRHLFYCVKTTSAFTFNAAVFHRQSDRQVKYADPRANPRGKLWDNVWGINPPIPRLVDNAEERLPDFKTQLPLALLTPIVEGFSNPGDAVLDPFSGSGTTVAAAHRTGRIGTGIEKNASRAKQSRIRIKGGL